MVVVRLQPVEYNPVSGNVWYYDELTLVVETAPADEPNTMFRGFLDDEKAVLNKIDNPAQLDSYRASGKLGSKAYSLLILTTPGFAASFEPLKAHHDANGIPTEIRTTTDVGSNNPDDVRAYIQSEFLMNGIDWVIIGGDDDVIPAKDLWVCMYESGSGESESAMPGDLYFACLDGTWNYDGDSRWGEPNDGEGGGAIDLTADVYIGRACGSTTAEIDRFVNKTLGYINGAGGQYLYEALLVGEYLGFWGRGRVWRLLSR